MKLTLKRKIQEEEGTLRENRSSEISVQDFSLVETMYWKSPGKLIYVTFYQGLLTKIYNSHKFGYDIIQNI